MKEVWLKLAVEDALSEAVVRSLVEEYRSDVQISESYGKTGFGLLRKRIGNWNDAARHLSFLVLTDLDNTACAPSLVREWLPGGTHPNLLFRVAVREVEAWLLADHLGWASFLGGRVQRTFDDTERLENPKSTLVEMVRRYGRKELREDIVPARGTSIKVGPNYNGCLNGYVRAHWQPERARQHADSLDRAIRALKRYQPRLEE
jgi:hypothetical protein